MILGRVYKAESVSRLSGLSPSCNAFSDYAPFSDLDTVAPSEPDLWRFAPELASDHPMRYRSSSELAAGLC